jgi:DNA-binding Lrp family transcriptional regulator
MNEDTQTRGGQKGRWHDSAEHILRRAEFLPEKDRTLLMAALSEGRTAQELAVMLGTTPRSIRRRLRRLSRHVLSDRFVFVMRHRDSWPATRRRIATACVLQRRTIRQTALDFRTSHYNVRKQLDAVAVLLDAWTLPSHAPQVSAPPNST